MYPGWRRKPQTKSITTKKNTTLFIVMCFLLITVFCNFTAQVLIYTQPLQAILYFMLVWIRKKKKLTLWQRGHIFKWISPGLYSSTSSNFRLTLKLLAEPDSPLQVTQSGSQVFHTILWRAIFLQSQTGQPRETELVYNQRMTMFRWFNYLAGAFCTLGNLEQSRATLMEITCVRNWVFRRGI